MVASYSVSFVLRTARQSKKGIPIYCRIRVGNTYAEFSTKLRIDKGSWSKAFQRVKHKAVRSCYVNIRLNEIEKDIEKIYQEFLLAKNNVVTAQIVKNRYLGLDNDIKGLKELILFFIKEKDSLLAEGSLKNYRYTYGTLDSFIKLQYGANDYPLKYLSIKFATLLENYLIKNTNCTNNGAMKHIQRLKTILNFGVKQEYLKTNPMNTFNISYKKVLPKYINSEELKTLENFQCENKALNKTRDFFLFACYTGFSYIEVKNLKKQHIVKGFDGEKWISINRQKTGTKEEVPLLPKADEIIQKYISDSNDFIIPIYSNQTINRYLKLLSNKLSFRNQISYHSGRHTFATTVALSNGVPLETLQKVLGHNSIRSTQIYGQIVNLKIANDFKHLRG